MFKRKNFTENQAKQIMLRLITSWQEVFLISESPMVILYYPEGIGFMTYTNWRDVLEDWYGSIEEDINQGFYYLTEKEYELLEFYKYIKEAKQEAKERKEVFYRHVPTKKEIKKMIEISNKYIDTMLLDEEVNAVCVDKYVERYKELMTIRN